MQTLDRDAVRAVVSLSNPFPIPSFPRNSRNKFTLGINDIPISHALYALQEIIASHAHKLNFQTYIRYPHPARAHEAVRQKAAPQSDWPGKDFPKKKLESNCRLSNPPARQLPNAPATTALSFHRSESFRKVNSNLRGAGKFLHVPLGYKRSKYADAFQTKHALTTPTLNMWHTRATVGMSAKDCVEWLHLDFKPD